ncbi:MAG: hypothetical protein LBU17_04005 [Treponema sp.]|jgi:hypothetical protein|nr:hypothetical protein [Treponema sp.]
MVDKKSGQRIILFQLEDTLVLGFDTGLDARAFAQAKLAQFITQWGYLVSAAGSIEPWRPGGVVQRDGTMCIWGPNFEGERLDVLIQDDTRKDEALNALRYWIQARRFLASQEASLPCPWPAGAFIDPVGTILFPPDHLIRQSIEAEGSEAWLKGAERWVHPDLAGNQAMSFAAGAMLYQVFCGSPPFPNRDIDAVRQDIREGVFLPPLLAAPGLDQYLARLISRAITVLPGRVREKKEKHLEERSTQAALEELGAYLGPPGTLEVASYIHPLGDVELVKFRAEQGRFKKKAEVRVKTKRFMNRNAAILTGVCVSILVLGGVIWSIMKGQADKPTTQGMNPLEVVETYYRSFGTLDHSTMDACVINKAGKEDIDMVTNFFVINKVREAYERTAPSLIAAQEWVDSGSLPTAATVFGISELRLEMQDQDERQGATVLQASYMLWIPDAAAPQGIPHTDELRLVLHKGAWRITEIKRDAASMRQ